MFTMKHDTETSEEQPELIAVKAGGIYSSGDSVAVSSSDWMHFNQL